MGGIHEDRIISSDLTNVKVLCLEMVMSFKVKLKVQMRLYQQPLVISQTVKMLTAVLQCIDRGRFSPRGISRGKHGPHSNSLDIGICYLIYYSFNHIVLSIIFTVRVSDKEVSCS